MGDITVDPKGVAKLLDGLNIHKAPGPDGLNARVLKECSNEIPPILALIFNESLTRGDIPDEWRQANDSSVFKKGEKYDADNYRPVSLTCICCKTLEHILVSNINRHLVLDSSLEVQRNPVGPVCARHHQQPGWGCELWTQTDRFSQRPLIRCHTGGYYIN